MKTLTKKLWLTILAFTLTLCTAFGVILTMPLAKADDSAAEPPDFSTWFAEPLELDDVIAQRYIRYTPSNADNYDATEEQFHWVSTQNIGLFFSSLTGDGRYNAMYNEDVIKPVAVEDKSYVYYIDLYEYEYHGLDDNDEQLDISVSIRALSPVKYKYPSTASKPVERLYSATDACLLFVAFFAFRPRLKISVSRSVSIGKTRSKNAL